MKRLLIFLFILFFSSSNADPIDPPGCGCNSDEVVSSSCPFFDLACPGYNHNMCCEYAPNPIPINSNLPLLISAGGILIGFLFFAERQARKRVK